MSIETLQNAMSALVKILRELLANMKEEERAITLQDFSVQPILNQRVMLLSSMKDFHASMMQEIDNLGVIPIELGEGDPDREKLLNLSQLVGEDKIELLTLRDQILALMQSIELQSMQSFSAKLNGVEKENYTNARPARRRPQAKKIPVQKKKVMLKTLERVSEEI